MILSLIYITSILMFFSKLTFFFMWIILEINMVIFILFSKILNQAMEKEEKSEMLFYIIIQTMGSLLFLMGFNMNSEIFVCNINTVSFVGIMMKMGLFPLEKWIYKMAKTMKSTPFILLITLQKIPLMILIMQMDKLMVLMILIMNLTVGSVMIIKSLKKKEMLISSSIYTTLWMILPLLISISMFLNFYIKYFVSVKLLMENKTWMINNKLSLFYISMAVMFFIGMPPMEMFFLKFFNMLFISKIYQYIFVSFLWLATIVATLGYFKLLYQTFMKMEKSNKMNLKKINKNSIFLLITMIMIFL